MVVNVKLIVPKNRRANYSYIITVFILLIFGYLLSVIGVVFLIAHFIGT